MLNQAIETSIELIELGIKADRSSVKASGILNQVIETSIKVIGLSIKIIELSECQKK